jgi:hypothetical protein
MIHHGWRWIMGKRFSLDLRERTIGFIEGGGHGEALRLILG